MQHDWVLLLISKMIIILILKFFSTLILPQERSCRVYPSHIYKSFMLEIGQELDVRGTIELVK